VPASQILTVPSPDPDATSLPPGENATACTEWPWSWSVLTSGPQLSSTTGPVKTHLGSSFLNSSRVKLQVGINRSADKYVWSGASLSNDPFWRRNRCASIVSQRKRDSLDVLRPRGSLIASRALIVSDTSCLPSKDLVDIWKWWRGAKLQRRDATGDGAPCP